MTPRRRRAVKATTSSAPGAKRSGVDRTVVVWLGF
jgi:hypothetical protein